jgi:hypothetical protein
MSDDDARVVSARMRPVPPAKATLLRQHVDTRLTTLRGLRSTWWAHWRMIADVMMPRRMPWLATPNRSRGGDINTAIVRSTATRAARTMAAGLMTGVTSPSRPWFKLSIPGVFSDATSPARVWLDEVQQRMLRVFAESNYYQAKATQYLDLGVFGTAPLIMYEDFDDVIRCYNPAPGEYFVANSAKMAVDTLYREFVYTVRQVAQEFGVDALSPQARALYDRGASSLDYEVKVAHAIEPNDSETGGGAVPDSFAWREVYWELGSNSDCVLRARGFHECPFSAPRWDVVGNDAYGRSPGMDALGDTRQLQLMIKRQAQIVDRIGTPPMIADVALRNEPATQLPGGITYVANANGVGFKPAYQVPPGAVEPITALIAKVELEIKETFHNDLFLMISQLDTVRTATEIDARREEKLIQLGPVLERMQGESLDVEIERVFAIMVRASRGAWARGQDGMLPLPPPELQSVALEVEYVSMLAQAQRAASTAGIERLAALVGNLAGGKPDVLDGVDFDEMVRRYADDLGLPPKIVVSLQQVQRVRAQRAQQQEASAAANAGLAAVQGAKTLSETDVGGGINALQLMSGAAMPGMAA